MAFEKITYSPGDVLSADQVNKIQDAIKTNEDNIETHFNDINPHNITPKTIGAHPNTWMPTSNDIGALKLYKYLDEIGVTKGRETIASIIAGMANYSMLMLNVNTDTDGYNADTYPAAWGFLVVKKHTLNRVEIDFMDVKSSSPKFYKKSYREALGNVYESDWIEFATTDYALNKAGDTMLGDLTVTTPSARGSISVIDGRYERKAQIEQNTDVARFNNLQDSANYSSVVLRPETTPLTERLQLIEKINDSQNNYNVLHTGNKKLITPEDIGAATVEVVSYTGTGTVGTVSVTFSKTPKFVYLHQDDNTLHALIAWGSKYAYTMSGTSKQADLILSFSGNKMSWSYSGTQSANHFNYMNTLNKTYTAIAFY